MDYWELARRVAKEYGHDTDDNTLGYIIWNHTGYPSFFDGDPRETFEQQLRDYFGGA